MKYLQKSFTVAVSSPRPKLFIYLQNEYDEARRQEAAKPHEYINGGVMCQLCGLGPEAKRHQTES